MSVVKRLPVALGGLGAVVVLGAGASFAVGGQQSINDRVRAALEPGRAKNVIFFLGDGLGTQEITAARYYVVRCPSRRARRRRTGPQAGGGRPRRATHVVVIGDAW